MNLSPSRSVILVVLSALVAAGVSACAGTAQATAVVVMGPWTGNEPGDEGHAFRKVLAAFEADTGIVYEYKETRALPQVLASHVQAGTPPDVAILSGAGDMVRYARNGQLFPVDDVLGNARQQFPASWLLPQEVKGVEHDFVVPVKVNLKSMIWYPKKTGPPAGVTTWEDLLVLSASMARAGDTPWCMGLGDGANSGWAATDFIEDIMLSGSGMADYQKWAAGELAWTSKEVTDAWNEWGKVAAGDGFVRGGREGAVLTDFADAGRPMFDEVPGCIMEHQASFIMGSYRNAREAGEPRPAPGTDFDFVPFPPFEDRSADGSPVIASADFAGMFKDTPESRQLMKFLATDEAQMIWPKIPGSGAFTVNKSVGPLPYGDDVSKRIATTLSEAPALCFDAADIMPATMRNAFYRAALAYLDDPTSLGSLLEGLERVRQDIPNEDWVGGLSCGR